MAIAVSIEPKPVTTITGVLPAVDDALAQREVNAPFMLMSVTTMSTALFARVASALRPRGR
ncbi:MAG: hypothetical protein U0235_31235 [Polyangiaceae bacterium]